MHVAASTGRVVAGRYLLQHPIGRGAMGTVWRAQDSLLARDVAVKEVRLRGPQPGTPGSPGGGPVTEETRVLYERSLREARTAARLNHPAVITVFDVFEDANGCPWIVMELIEGRSLEQIVAQDGPLPPQRAAKLGGRLLSALRCAHAAGILHRDVKPSNVLLGADGRAVLTDFGIATLEGDSTLTQAGMVMGTPGFTAPERVRGEPASPASDLWSLGATLFAAVEGHGLFDDRNTSLAILAAIANEDPPRPRRAGPLGPAIEALLRRDPRARPDPATAARMLAAAQDGSSAAGSGLLAPPDSAAGSRLLTPPDGPAGSRLLSPPDSAAGSRLLSPPDSAAGSRLLSPPDSAAGSRLLTPPDSAAGSRVLTPPDSPAATQVPLNHHPDQPELHLLSPADEPAGTLASPAQDWAEAGPGWPGRRPGARHGAPGPSFSWPLPAGLRDWLARTPRWLLATLAGLLIVAAGLLIGLAAARGGGRGAAGGPGGGAGGAVAYRGYTVAGTATDAGYTLRLPAGWHAVPHGRSTHFLSPGRTVSVVVYPVPAAAAVLAAEAQDLRQTMAKQHAFPGFQGLPTPAHLVHFTSGTGFSWSFRWQPPGGSRREVVETLLHPAGAGLLQRFVIQEIAPTSALHTAGPAFASALRTFRLQP